MIGIVTIGHYLLRQALHSLLAAIQSRFQLAIIDGIGGGFHIHNQSVGGVGNQLYVVAGNGAPLTVSHHMSLGVGSRGSGYVIAIVFPALLQRLGVCRLSLPLRLARSSLVLASEPKPDALRSFLYAEMCYRWRWL